MLAILPALLAIEVTQKNRHPSARLSWVFRLALIAIGGGLVVLLGIAATLKPNQQGYGTHQQLGLPPCSFQSMVGLRCPSCGMTTAWSNMVRGQVLRAMRANTGGALLAIVAAVVGPWSLLSGMRGRWLGAAPHEGAAVVLAITIVVVTLLDWSIRLMGG